jgi:hypothetical protein
MPQQPRPREASRAMKPASLSGAERYQRYQREATSGNRRASNGARPLEFDESGFPVPQRGPGFFERVARLLT